MKNTKAHLRLAAFIAGNGMKNKQFAASIGVSVGQLSRWINGKVTPSRPIQIMLEMITDGEVEAGKWN